MNETEYLTLLPGIRELFARAFGRPIAEEVLKWKFLRHPSGETRITVIVRDGKLVSHYASLPADLRWKGRLFKAGISGTVMTDPAYGGRGLFQEAGKRQYAALASAGYDLGFTFTSPGRHTDSVFLGKMGWAPLYEIPTLTLSLAHKNIPEGLGEAESDPDFKKHDYSALDDRDGLLHVPRTAEYLRWRYALHPLNKYSVLALAGPGRAPAAYGIFKAYGGGPEKAVDLVDFWACDPPALERLLRAVAVRAKAEGALAVNAWSPRHHYSHHRLKAFGFRHSLPVTYAAYRPFRDGLGPELGWYNNWWLMMGDSDVY